MKMHISRLIKIMICIVLIVNLSGCWNRRELDTLAIVLGVGMDKPDVPDKIKITAQIVKPGEIRSPEKKGGGGGDSKAYWNAEGKGNTVFSTVRELTKESSRKLYFPHNQVLLFSRSIAEEGIQEYLDFFTRDPETRANVWFLISEGMAGEILDVKSALEKVPANNIAKLVEGQAAATSQTISVRLREFMDRLISKTTAPVAPFIEISGEGDKKSVMISGTAVFKKDKLVGKMDEVEGRGLLWILGEVKSGIIEVDSSNNNKVSLEIIRAKSKIEPEIDNNRIKIKVTINEEGNIGEQAGPENLSKLGEIAQLEKEKSKVIRNEVMAALKIAQELNTDVFGFGEAVHHKYKREWEDMEDRWDEIFPRIEVEVNVEAKLRLMGRINKPVAPEQEKK